MVMRIAAELTTRVFAALSAILLRLNRRRPGSGLRLIGSRFLPGDLMIDDTLVGGLSGIDRDPVARRWVAVTDDRSTDAPARFYTVDLAFTGGRLSDFGISGAVTLLRENAEPFPTYGSPGRVPDIESIRVEPATGEIWYVTEGDGLKGLAPMLAVAAPDGRFVRSIPLPGMFTVTKNKSTGPRHNQAFESLAFAPNGSVWLCLEGPMYEDGDPPAMERSAPVRLSNIDRDGSLLRQVAYELEPMRRSGSRFELAGVSEIIAIDDERLLAVEREATIGRLRLPRFAVRIYEIDLRGATDVQAVGSLRGAAYVPVRKRLVLDMTWRNSGLVTNVEGVAFGPPLENGHRTLVLITDNNQIALLPTQVIAFEILDPTLSPGGQGCHPGLRDRLEQST